MKIFYFFISIFFLYIHSLNAQTNGNGDMQPPEINGQYVTIPPSPSSYEFTKYGNIEANEFKGHVSHSIPLFNYQAGKLTLPVSMDYSGSGVKVAQLSSWTGINWNLNAGGVITRTVKDRPDELAETNRVFFTSASSSELMQLDPSLLHSMANPINNYDTQLDEFNFHFLNYSGSFYLNEDNDFILATYDNELQIEKSGIFTGSDSDGIIITTPDGIKYYFGGYGFIEKSEIMAANSGSNSANIWNTSYYLAYIQHPTGDIINFTYGSGMPYRLRWSRSERMTHIYENSAADLDTRLEPGYNGPVKQLIYNRIYNGRFLQEITSNRTDVVINFNSSSVSTSTYDYVRVLNNMTVSNSNDLNLCSVDFSYDFPLTANQTHCRFFLTKIDHSAKGEYRFEYYDGHDLPDRFSYAQDFFGYYNGKNSNTTLLPANASQYFPQGANGIIFADKSPSFGYAVTGALEKVIYPTGGHTLFEYESNPKSVRLDKQVRLDVFNNKQAFYPPGYPASTQLTAGGGIGTCLAPIPGSQGPQPQPLSSDQKIEFDLRYTVLSGSNTQWYDFEVTIRDITTGPASIFYQQSFNLQGHPAPEPGDPPSYTHHIYFEKNFEKDHCYSVELKLIVDQGPSGTENEPVQANLSFSYFLGYGCEPNGIGLRVKRITDFAESGEPTNIKRYYYKSIKDYIENDEKCYPVDYVSYYTGNAIISLCIPPSYEPLPGTPSGPLYVPFISADTHNSVVKSAADGFSYEYVTISFGGDNFEEGGIEKRFYYVPKNSISNALSNSAKPAPANYANSITSNQHVFSGKLISKKYLIKKDDGIKISKKEKYHYSDYWADYTWNLYLDQYYCNCDASASSPIYTIPYDDEPFYNPQEGFFAGFYRSFQNKLELDTVTETEYIDPLPILNQDDDAGYHKIVRETYYEYGQYTGLPSKITKTTSNSEKKLITRLYYPDIGFPASVLNANPPPDQEQLSSWNELFFTHRFETPIQTETYSSDNGILKLLASKRILYSTLLNGLHPISIESSKGNAALEEIVFFEGYNSYGELTSLSIKGGSTILYTYSGGKVTSKTIGPQTTYYEYDSLDRLIKITDPRGKETNFEYDPAGRLEQVKDHAENILESYEYNYRPH